MLKEKLFQSRRKLIDGLEKVMKNLCQKATKVTQNLLSFYGWVLGFLFFRFLLFRRLLKNCCFKNADLPTGCDNFWNKFAQCC